MFHTRSNYSINPRHFSGLMNEFLQNSLNHVADEPGHMNVPANIKESENAYEIHLVAPGLKKDDFKIQVDKNVLSISFEQKEENKEEAAKFLRNEYKFRSFKRSFKLNDKVNASAIAAKYEDGILNVSLPKNELTQPESQVITVN
ncbi:MAG: Hsp20/alpha crystallin family protein [Sphingobacteriales bacterium]|nr:MAG: Hsp20/alpha crystallin family protein [Sphingobacteriales bacterium]